MTEPDLQSVLADALSPVEDEGFSDRVMGRIRSEELLARVAPEPRSRRWALSALALSAGLVAGTVARSSLDLSSIPAPEFGSLHVYAAAALAVVVLWLVADPDALA